MLPSGRAPLCDGTQRAQRLAELEDGDDHLLSRLQPAHPAEQVERHGVVGGGGPALLGFGREVCGGLIRGLLCIPDDRLESQREDVHPDRDALDRQTDVLPHRFERLVGAWVGSGVEQYDPADRLPEELPKPAPVEAPTIHVRTPPPEPSWGHEIGSLSHEPVDGLRVVNEVEATIGVANAVYVEPFRRRARAGHARTSEHDHARHVRIGSAHTVDHLFPRLERPLALQRDRDDPHLDAGLVGCPMHVGDDARAADDGRHRHGQAPAMG